MHDNNHTDDFNDYLQQQVNDHRMYPSDRVWKNVRSKIQPHKKWPALSVFTVLIISALVVGTMLTKPVPDSITPNFAYSLQSPAIAPASKPNTLKTDDQLAANGYAIDQLTSTTITAAVEKIKIDEAVALQLSNNNYVPFENASNAVAQNTSAETIASADIYSLKNLSKEQTALPAAIAQNNSPSFKYIDNYLFDVTSRLKSILNTEPLRNYAGGVAFFSGGRRHEREYNYFDFSLPAEHKELLPALDKLGKTSSRFDFRFYITPSVSYRRLNEKNQAAGNKNSGASLEADYRVDPSTAINHNPALGYETGLGLGYKLSNKFTLTGGFQFNISQYKINAFLHNDETASVTLNKGEYASTVSTVSSLRSIPGTKPLTIKNRYYQISMPLGIEWNILGNNRFSWGMGASVQPTYTFDKQPLIISNNYKNYADGSAYVRNLNINTNIETFLGYTTGSYRWQIGPQLRYQVLPSLVDKYPNREYLINYGLKVGVVKQLK